MSRAYCPMCTSIMRKYNVPETKKPTAFSLFAGCGGIDLGFVQAGFAVVGANEWDPDAAITYMTNLCSNPIHIHYLDPNDKTRLDKAVSKMIRSNDRGEITYYPVSGSGWIKNNPDMHATRDFWFGDVRLLKGKDILRTLNMNVGEIDIVVGGPPCQGFSTANPHRTVGDERNSMVYEFARVITELRPSTFFMENVPNMRNVKDPDGNLILDVFFEIIGAADYKPASDNTVRSLKKMVAPMRQTNIDVWQTEAF